MLERVGLGERTAHFPHELSGGEQQRVAIARALATGNPILLADEPTGELDFRTGVQILQLLHDQTHEQGTSVLVVTHNREIARVADRVIELSSGRVVSDGPSAGRARRHLRAALVGADALGVLAACGRGATSGADRCRSSSSPSSSPWAPGSRPGSRASRPGGSTRTTRASRSCAYHDVRVSLPDGGFAPTGRLARAVGAAPGDRRGPRAARAADPGRRLARRPRRSSCPGCSSASGSTRGRSSTGSRRRAGAC